MQCVSVHNVNQNQLSADRGSMPYKVAQTRKQIGDEEQMEQILVFWLASGAPQRKSGQADAVAHESAEGAHESARSNRSKE